MLRLLVERGRQLVMISRPAVALVVLSLHPRTSVDRDVSRFRPVGTFQTSSRLHKELGFREHVSPVPCESRSQQVESAVTAAGPCGVLGGTPLSPKASSWNGRLRVSGKICRTRALPVLLAAQKHCGNISCAETGGGI